ncbi:MAG: [protein-PII] uridylyltransferase [Candidatus Rokubacteria bacterium]|nr:[protein-PII] uridylyltransferase [Candidatus Rokubacteria bacterium]
MVRALASRLRRAEGELERAYTGPAAEWPERRRRLRLDLFRELLAAAYAELRSRHAGGASGEESVRGHAAFMDGFLRLLFQLAGREVRGSDRPRTPLVLVALGGYGRGELHPSSDLDLMLIHEREVTPYVQRMAQEILYTLWDLGLRVGHACRSLADCLALARTDLPSRTSMQAARFLAGDRRLFARLQRTLRKEVYRKDYAEFLRQTLAEREERYRKHGGSVYVQEPNVKESAGGLRDVHTALWLAFTKFGARSLKELEEKGLLTPRERAATDGALTFLWRVRNELHFLAGTKQDVLERDLQARIAKSFGYETDEVRLDVEKFMRDYYLHARAIHRISGRLIARCQARLAGRGVVGRRVRRAALADGLVVYDGRLHLAEPGALQKDPARILRVFWHAQQLGCELGADLERAVEDTAPLLEDEARRASPELRSVFLSILRSWGRVATTLRRMHDTGVLGAYLPEFGALTCLVQYDHYHRYTVDQHSLLAVEALEGLAPGQGLDSDELSQLIAGLERPELLMMGVLLHDVGKALGSGHAAKGVPLIKALARRLNLDPEDAATVEFLVEHHLLFAHVAERRDIEDPKTVERLASVVRFPAWLTMLYLLTRADVRAVGPGVWNAWRGALLGELFVRTRTRLAGRRPKPPRRAAVALRIVQALADPTYASAAAAHLQAMSDRYVRTTSPQRMAAHLRLIDRLREEPVATELFHYRDVGASDLVVVTRDARGLFALIAGTLAAHGANILSAEIETRADGIAVDTFHVNEAGGEAILDESRWEAVTNDLRRTLSGAESVESLFARRRRSVSASPGDGRPVQVTVDNSVSDTHTVVEVKAPDRVGLLYLITRALAQEGLNIATAKIATERDQAFDAFYVTDAARRKVEAPARIATLRGAIVRALDGEDAPRAGTV